MKIREEFERWYVQEGEYGGLPLDRHGEDGDYQNDAVQAMWAAWQAAIAGRNAALPKGDVQAMGNLTFDSEDHYENALLIQFESKEQCLESIRAGECRYTVFGGEA